MKIGKVLFGFLLSFLLLFAFTVTPSTANAMDYNVDRDVVSDNIAYIADYIDTYGYVISDGRKVIASDDSINFATISYDGSTLQFLYTDDGDGYSTWVSMKISLPYSEVISPKVSVYLQDSDYIHGDGTIDLSDYDKDEDNINFQVTTGGGSEEAAKLVCNKVFNVAYNSWSLLCIEKIGVVMEMLGFTSMCEHGYKEDFVEYEPTCTDTGLNRSTCMICGKYDYEEIEPTGHNFGKWTILNDTQHQRVCANDSSHVEKANHNWNLDGITKAATCTTAGVRTFTCSVCEGTKTEPIPATGHNYGKWTKLNDTQHQRVCANDSNHVEKANHTWDAGTVTKKATVNEGGAKVYKCTACDASYTETIPKLEPEKKPEPTPQPEPKKKPDPTQQKGSDGTALGSGASAAAAEKAITNMKNDNDPAGAMFSRIMLNSKKQSAKTIALQWKKVKGAKKYTIYGNACGKANKMKKIATVKTNKFTVKKVAKGKLKKGTYYKFIVVAVNAKDKVVSSSKVIHVATKGSKKNANHTKITVKPKKGIKLKVKKTAKLKVTVIKAKKTTVKKHVGIRYESTNKKVATVSKKGVIKGKAKGKCKVYAYAQNGLYKAVNVTVK